MKLKPVVLAVVAAGLVGPAFAAYGHSQRAHASTCAGALKMTHAQEIMNGNNPVSAGNSSACWQNRVRFSGDLTAQYYSVKGAESSASKRISSVDVSQANLYVDALLNSNWTARLAVSHNWLLGGQNAPLLNYASGDVNSNASGDATDGALAVTQAYAQYSHQGAMPLYVKVGRSYVNFGNNHNPLNYFPTIVDSLSVLNENGIELGAVSSQGWHASMNYWKQTAIPSTATTARHGQYAVKLGVDEQKVVPGVGLSGNVSYLSNIETALVGQASVWGDGTNSIANLTANNPAFDVHLSASLPAHFRASMDYLHLGKDIQTGVSSKMSVLGFGVGYSLKAMGYEHDFDVNYEDLSKGFWDHRWSVDYAVGIASNVQVFAKYMKMKHNSSTGIASASTLDAKGVLVGLKGSF